MAMWVKVHAAKPDAFSSMPDPTRWKERTYSPKMSSNLYMLTVASAPSTYAH